VIRKNLLFIFCTSLLSISVSAQTISINPKNVAPIGNISTGNKVTGKCDGNSKDYIKVNIQPSCYGANLRGGGTVLDPGQGDVVMNLAITNSGSTFTTDIQFPNKITWPENYGQTCSWDNGTKVTCDVNNGLVKVSYNCSYIYGGSKYGVQWFLDDYLDCSRVADPASHGALNQNVKCGFLYSWSGTGYAAVQSYRKIANVANCGLQDPNVDLAAQVLVENMSTPASSITKFAKRGKVTVDFNGLAIKKIQAVKNTGTGEYLMSGSRSSVVANFYQIKGGAKYALTQKVEAGFDDFEECLDIKASFIGTNQFCGSFYSPLMVFFDHKRPVFAGKSSFPLIAGVTLIAWPEKGAPGFFLALDEAQNKKIVRNSQLFGDSNGAPNGFESLRKLDSNKDGVINAQDEKFSKLVLWQDKNSNGVSEEDEVFSLDAKKVKSFSLDYKDDRRKSFGRNAEGRQYSHFTYGDKDKTGDVVDMWFAPFNMDEIKKK
jgi:hypothetical protein